MLEKAFRIVFQILSQKFETTHKQGKALEALGAPLHSAKLNLGSYASNKIIKASLNKPFVQT